jgi:hypothetical protein
MDSNNISDYKGFSPDPENPWNKVHGISDKLFVVINEAIAKRLGINGIDTWVEQIVTPQRELLLRKHSIKEVDIN